MPTSKNTLRRFKKHPYEPGIQAALQPYFIYRAENFHANRDDMTILPVVGKFGAALKYDVADDAGRPWSWRLPLRRAVGLDTSGLKSVGWTSDPGVRVCGRLLLRGSRLTLNFQDAPYNQF